ncbi:MAG: HAMP domain-containing histidine kinase [Planctomycetes bacterium]|nr:HAMP domain-containing histidine kinase [Planctomycetota bacterium]
MRFSIRYQLLVPLLALMLGLVGASTWSAYSSGQRARRQIETQIDDIATTVNEVSFPLTAQTLHLMKGLSGADFLLCDEKRVPIRDDDGKIITTLTESPDALPSPSRSPAQHFDTPVRVGEQSFLCGGMPLQHSPRPGVILYIFYPESLWQEAAWQALRPALMLGIGGGVVAVVLSVLLAQMLSRRIQDLERRTRLIAEGDFSPMPMPPLDDELRDLARSVNDMAQRLAQFQDTIRQTERLRLLGQVSGGLAHQLRNGVAGARLAVQLHARECPSALQAKEKGADDGEELAVALRQLSLVEMHLKRFLDLGKAVELQRRPCLLDELVRDTVQLLGPQCRHAKIDLRLTPPPEQGISLTADPEQLGHVFLNIFTNAIEAAGPHGWVEARWGADAVGAFVEICDSGPGPSPEVAARLFEPFVTGKREGVGLGLAVARQVALAHGGAVTWKREGNCTCFRINLPLAA